MSYKRRMLQKIFFTSLLKGADVYGCALTHKQSSWSTGNLPINGRRLFLMSHVPGISVRFSRCYSRDIWFASAEQDEAKWYFRSAAFLEHMRLDLEETRMTRKGWNRGRVKMYLYVNCEQPKHRAVSILFCCAVKVVVDRWLGNDCRWALFKVGGGRCNTWRMASFTFKASSFCVLMHH